MAGGGNIGGSSTAQALQNYPIVPNSAGGAQSMGAGASPQAQSLSQLQTILQKLGQSQGAQKSPAMAMAGMGQQLMQQGQMQARPPMPMQRPVGAAPPMQGAVPPQMGSPGMANGNMGMNPSQLSMLLARQNGLMG